MRRTFGQLRASRFPSILGMCQDNIPGIADACNDATQRLLYDFSEFGPWGAWDKVLFQASRLNPYITLPYQYSRAINLDICRFPYRIQNQFYEMLDAGIGLRGPTNCTDCCAPMEAYDRANFSTMRDLDPANQFLRIYPTNSADIGKSLLFSNAKDQNGQYIYTTADTGPVNGFILELNSPFTTTDFVVTSFQQIQKDITLGEVVLTQVNSNDGTEVELSRFQPDETNPAYRRYYLSNLPASCCPPPVSPFPATSLLITAMCKREFIPVAQDTDQLIIGNFPALFEEAQAINYSRMDSPNASAKEAIHHKKAITLLQHELTHYLGTNIPATNFAPFGTARLECSGIGWVT